MEVSQVPIDENRFVNRERVPQSRSRFFWGIEGEIGDDLLETFDGPALGIGLWGNIGFGIQHVSG